MRFAHAHFVHAKFEIPVYTYIDISRRQLNIQNEFRQEVVPGVITLEMLITCILLKMRCCGKDILGQRPRKL